MPLFHLDADLKNADWPKRTDDTIDSLENGDEKRAAAKRIRRREYNEKNKAAQAAYRRKLRKRKA